MANDIQIISWSILIAVISLDISRTRVCRPIRDWVSYNFPSLGHLIKCPWCLSHWIALAVCYWLDQPLLPTVFVLIGWSALWILVGAILFWVLDL